MIDPIGNYKTSNHNMLNVSSIPIFECVVWCNERMLGELIAKVHEFSLPSFRQAKNKFGNKV